MRYEDEKNKVDTQKKQENTETEFVREAESGEGAGALKNSEDTGTEMVDRFQKAVCEAGNRVLNLISEEGLDLMVHQDRMERAKDALAQLGAFRYNIGFAGPQSCGKSSLINAVIQYPLMPTCNLATTCTPVELLYSKVIRVLVTDEDRKGKIIFDKKCGELSEEDFNRLRDYAFQVMGVAIIENLQFFCDDYIADEMEIDPGHITMDPEDARQAALLILILFTVYVSQNNRELNDKERKLNELRRKTLSYFGVGKDSINYRVIVQWDNPLLASGLMITDLPGLGAAAEDKEIDGKWIKGHDTITREAVLKTDTMVFMSEPLVMGDAVPVLKEMVSNAALRDAVSAEDRIVAIMNKSDTFSGAAQKQSAIDRMLGMMQNAGVNMTGRKVWELSSFFGEFAYEGLDRSRSFYVRREIYKLKNQDYDEEDIADEMPSILKRLEKGYQKSGVDELREFFRTAFIGRAKYDKTFSAIAALRAFALDSMSPIQVLIHTDSALAGVNRDIADNALKNLKEAAITPLDEAQRETGAEVNGMIEDDYVVDALIESAANKYVQAFDNAVNEYSEKLRKIADKFELTFLGLGSRARVDSSNTHNHELYEELLAQSGSLQVDLTAVNREYTNTLSHCSKDIEKIYRTAQERMNRFKENYPGILEKCIESYRSKTDDDTLGLMYDIMPVLRSFVEDKIQSADASIQQQKSVFGKVGDALAIDIAKMNAEYNEILLRMVKDKLNTVSGGWFVKKEFLIVDGENGLKNTINILKLSEADKKASRADCSAKGYERIKMPLLEWYKNAENDVAVIMSSLAVEIAGLFKKLQKNLLDDLDDKNTEIQKNKEALEKLEKIFAGMGDSIQTLIDAALEAGVGFESESLGKMKGDMFEGKLKQGA